MAQARPNQLKRVSPALPEMAAKSPDKAGLARANLAGANDAAPDLAILRSMKDIRNEWKQLEQQADISVYQRYDWVEQWVNHNLDEDERLVLVTGRYDGDLAILLPLVMRNGWINRLDFVGWPHSNFNMAIINERYRERFDRTTLSAFLRSLAEMMPGIGFIKLSCQPVEWNGRENPLLQLPTQRSTNKAFGVSLEGGFEAVLDAGNGKRKRKKFRTQQRALIAVGGAELVRASTKVELREMLDCFVEQKSARLREMGVDNIFEEAETRRYLLSSAIRGLEQAESELCLFGLKIDGSYHAILGGGFHGGHFSASLSSYADDEWSSISPGELLLYLTLEHLAQSGCKSVDLGVGEERYKRSWCPLTIELFDVLLPLSNVSRLVVWAGKSWLHIKRTMRSRQWVWRLIKAWRAHAGIG